ncbi:MAG: hypothetical protein WDN06_13565 [Asticcacaulis sp.]
MTPQGPMPYVPGGQTTPAPATTAPASASLSNDTDAQVLMLVRSSLTALQQANQTGNYDVLYALGSSEFQKANTPQKLGDAFAALKPYNLISVEVLEPPVHPRARARQGRPAVHGRLFRQRRLPHHLPADVHQGRRSLEDARHQRRPASGYAGQGELGPGADGGLHGRA